jgi:hypothetical protein
MHLMRIAQSPGTISRSMLALTNPAATFSHPLAQQALGQFITPWSDVFLLRSDSKPSKHTALSNN